MNSFLKYVILILTISSGHFSYAQFTQEDSIRGSITDERAWWDLTHYHLSVDINPEDSSLTGSNVITYKVLQEHDIIQIDLQAPLSITEVVQNGSQLNYKSIGNAHFINLKKKQKAGDLNQITIYYKGKPHVAIRAPWDGGITWSRDSNDLPFIASSCQGIGASIWWPCKDHMYDEPDSMMISVTTPPNLMNISNGRLFSTTLEQNGNKTYNWKVVNPINNYGVNLSIGDYVHFKEEYQGLNGPLDLDYYVLRENEEKAKLQFQQVPMMMEAFEHWFGPYPFYKDGFKLVEVPYLGMEHQSAITYGNKYKNGYLGRDLSGTGWGLEFDFIIIHESGHEWFANNITYKDIADMWIHESFTAYSESIYVEYFHGIKAGADYVIGTRRNISNDQPIIGTYNYNAKGSGDMYYKGSNMLHTLRQIVGDDEKWRDMLRGLNEEFYHQTVTSAQIEDFMSSFLDLDLSAFFDQYLRTTSIPTLEYGYSNGFLQYRWTNAVHGFNYPVKIYIDDELVILKASTNWNSRIQTEAPASFMMDRNYFVGSMNIFGL